MIHIKVRRKGVESTIEVEDDSDIEELLHQLGLLLDAHLVTIAGKPVPTTRKLSEGETLVVIQVASGG